MEVVAKPQLGIRDFIHESATMLADAIRAAEVIFVCVGTPPQEDGSADMSQIEEVARMIAENLNGYKLVVEKSTVPVQTTQWIRRTIEGFVRTAMRVASTVAHDLRSPLRSLLTALALITVAGACSKKEESAPAPGAAATGGDAAALAKNATSASAKRALVDAGNKAAAPLTALSAARTRAGRAGPA